MKLDTFYTKDALKTGLKKVNTEYDELLEKYEFDEFRCHNIKTKPIIVSFNSANDNNQITLPLSKYLLLRGNTGNLKDVPLLVKDNTLFIIYKNNSLIDIYKNKKIKLINEVSTRLRKEDYIHEVDACINRISMEIEIDGYMSSIYYESATSDIPTYDGSINGGEFKVFGNKAIIRRLTWLEKYPRYKSTIQSTHMHLSDAIIYPILVYSKTTSRYTVTKIMKNVLTHSEFEFLPFFGRSYNWASEENVSFKDDNRYSAIVLPSLTVDIQDNEFYVENNMPDDIDEDENEMMYYQPTLEFRLPRITCSNQYIRVKRWLRLLLYYTFLKLSNSRKKLTKRIYKELINGRTNLLEKAITESKKIYSKKFKNRINLYINTHNDELNTCIVPDDFRTELL